MGFSHIYFKHPTAFYKYQERKEQIRQEAILWEPENDYYNIPEQQEYFRKMAKRYGLVKEFEENAVKNWVNRRSVFFHLISSQGNGKFPSEFRFCWIAENNYDTIIAIIFWLFVLNVPDFEMSALPTFFIYFHIILTL